MAGNVPVYLDQGGAKLTDDEMDFMNAWKGEYYVVRSPEEALEVIGR